jgi:hypothetical protein
MWHALCMSQSCHMSQRCHLTPLISAESLTPLWHAQRSHWHRCDMHSWVIDTAVTLDIIIARLWLPLKEITIKKAYIGKLSYTIPITFTHTKWGLTRNRFLTQRSHWHHCDKNWRLVWLHSRFSRRILIHIQKGFNPCIRGPGEVVWWRKKTRGRKSRVRVPLNHYDFQFIIF